MLASLFQFSFLCVVALANLCLGFAIASRLGFAPRLGGLFQLDQAIAEQCEAGDCELSEIRCEAPSLERPIDEAEPESVESTESSKPTGDDADQSDEGSRDSDVINNMSESTTATSGVD